MNKLVILFMLFSILFFSCKQKPDEKSDVVVETMKLETIDVVDSSKIVKVPDSPIKDVVFKNPDKNTIYFCTDKFIGKINQFNSTIDTILKYNNILDFFINQTELYLVEFNTKDSILIFYKTNIDNVNLSKIFSVKVAVLMGKLDKFVENYNQVDQEKLYFNSIMIKQNQENKIQFYLFFYGESTEGPYTPNVLFEYQSGKYEIIENENYYSSNNNTYENETTNPFILEEDILKYDDGKNQREIANDKVFENYQGDGQIFVSPNYSNIVWAAQIDWFEGPIYSYYYVDKNGKQGEIVKIRDEFTWIDNDKLIFNSWDGLFLVDQNHKTYKICDEIKRYMFLDQDIHHKLFNIYYY